MEPIVTGIVTGLGVMVVGATAVAAYFGGKEMGRKVKDIAEFGKGRFAAEMAFAGVAFYLMSTGVSMLTDLKRMAEYPGWLVYATMFAAAGFGILGGQLFGPVLKGMYKPARYLAAGQGLVIGLGLGVASSMALGLSGVVDRLFPLPQESGSPAIVQQEVQKSEKAEPVSRAAKAERVAYQAPAGVNGANYRQWQKVERQRRAGKVQVRPLGRQALMPVARRAC